MKQYGLTAEGLRRIRDAADSDKRHTYEWYVIENINTPAERMECTPVLEDAVRMYAALNGGDKRLGVTKDGIAAVDLVIRHGGREWVSEDRLKSDSFKSDLTVSDAVAAIRRVLDGQTSAQGVEDASGTNRKEDDRT